MLHLFQERQALACRGPDENIFDHQFHQNPVIAATSTDLRLPLLKSHFETLSEPTT
jgi:hypothetical protein